MKLSNPNLKINLEDYNEFFISADVSKEGPTLVINMNITGIKLLDKILDGLKDSNSIDASEILIRSSVDGFTPLDVFMLYKAGQRDDLYTFSINYSFTKNAAYVLLSESAIVELKTTLSYLYKRLELDITEDISYMIDEWGGSGLTANKFVDVAEIVGHLRLYSII